MRNRIFTVIVIFMLLVPSAGVLVFGPAQPAANETLASAPSLTESDGSFNWEILDDLTDWWADRFALRQEMVTAERQLIALVFGESGEDDVILGKDGWFFYGETLDDYQAVNTMTEREVWAAARSLWLMQEYCGEKGITFLFTVAPNKNSLYGEYMPARYAEGDLAARNISRLAEILEESDVFYVDLYAVLSAEDEVLYRKGDSHWNTRGASLAGDTILEALEVEFEPFYDGSWSTVYEEIGDLYEMVYPTGTELDEDQSYDRAFTFIYVNAIRSTGDNRILTTSEGKSGSLVMYRDSFGNTLHTYLAEAFGSALFSRITPYDFTLLDSQAADTVVVELAERNLAWLNTLAPVMAAPERSPGEILDTAGAGVSAAADTEDAENIDAAGSSASGSEDSGAASDEAAEALAEAIQDVSGTVEVMVSESASLAGYVEVTGSLSERDMDVDSPIYLQCGSVIYEATPAGEGEAPFTAYLPSDMLSGEAGEMCILVVQNGQLVRRQLSYING